MPSESWPNRFLRAVHRKKKRNTGDTDVSATGLGSLDSANQERPPDASQAPVPISVVTSTAVSRNDSANSEFVPAPDPTSVTASATTSSAAVRNASTDSENPPRTTASGLLSASLHGFQEVLKIVKEVSDACPPLKGAVSGVLACVDAYQETPANQEEMERLIKSIDTLASLVARRLKGMRPTNDSHQKMKNLARDLENIVKDIKGLQAHGLIVRLAMNSIKEVFNVFQLEVGLEIERKYKIFSMFEVVIRDLRRSRDAFVPCRHQERYPFRGPCTAGTRIMAWARADDADSPPVFWLTGLAGTGKTTIAYTISERIKDSQLIVPTICRNLAEIFRSYASELVPIFKDAPPRRSSDPSQIDNLLVAPWSRHFLNGMGYLHQWSSLMLSMKAITRLTGIKFLVTSRVEPEIVELCHSFQLPADMICRLHEVPLDDVQDDIAKFLAEKLPRLRDTDEFTQLSHRAGGLFISAATAVRYISPPHHTLSHDEQREKLQKLLKPGGPSGSTLLLDQLYEQVLSAAFDEEDEEFLHRRLDILHAVVCAQELISIPVIAQLLGLNEATTKTCIDSLHSVLHVSSSLVSCYHASFPEFILDTQRSRFSAPLSFTKEKSRELQVFCDKPVFDARLAHHCFRIMRSELRFNICCLPSSFMLDCETWARVSSV
ncbi:hypothetical protein BDZ89DRAFT_1068644 [Hymenopellis radicata]|nr:hypothetical protein BDZ89DRAFT_1068644 [Hymenopellis radicata]